MMSPPLVSWNASFFTRDVFTRSRCRWPGVWLISAPAVTRSLTVDFLSPVPLHEQHRIIVEVEKEEGRKVFVAASGKSSDAVRFTAHGVYVKVPFDHFDSFGELPDPVDEVKRRLTCESGRPDPSAGTDPNSPAM